MRSTGKSWREFMLWLRWQRLRAAMRTRLYGFGLGALILAILTITSAIVTGIELGDFAYSMDVKTRLATEIESFPDQWNESIDQREHEHSLFPDEGITPYRAELERELLKAYRPKAEAMARRIREMRDDEFYTQLGSKSLQAALSGVGGQVVGRVAGRFVGAGKVADAAKDIGRQVSDWHFNAWTINDLRGKNDLEWALQNRRDLMQKEMEFLTGKELQNWRTAEPLLQARLATHIRYLKNMQKGLSDEEYAKLVRARAISIDQTLALTRAFGSQDSPWANYEELMKWLAEQVGRPLKEPSPKGQGRANVTFEGYTLKWHKVDMNSFDYTLRYRGGAVGVTLDEVEEYWNEEAVDYQHSGWRWRGPGHEKGQLHPPVRIEAGEDRLVTWKRFLPDDVGLYRQRTVWRGKDDNGNPVEIEFTIEINSTKPQQ